MKKALLSIAFVIGLSTSASAKVVTLTVNKEASHGQIILTNTVSIGTNEVATIISMLSSGDAQLDIVKDGVLNFIFAPQIQSYNRDTVRPYVIAGPATFILRTQSSLVPQQA
jgi:hypothetical protein